MLVQKVPVAVVAVLADLHAHVQVAQTPFAHCSPAFRRVPVLVERLDR